MASPTCPKCPSIYFELKEMTVKGARFKMYAVICQSCGCIISTEDYYNTHATLEMLARKLGVNLDR
jgi:predicted nucleic-acid-binding Zn-ribbon protein